MSTVCGVPVATVKYYLREGLLPAGRLTSATQAQYDTTHVARLNLIRALAGAGGLSVAAIRDVLAGIDQPPESVAEVLGTAHRALGTPLGTPEKGPEARPHPSVMPLLEKLGWWIDGLDQQALDDASAALYALDAADFPISENELIAYGRSMEAMAQTEIAGIPNGSREEAVRYVVLGTILIEPLILALRRLAHDDAAIRRFGPG
nr:MerR family transcriptional regulator [Spelaeicoccus albus]